MKIALVLTFYGLVIVLASPQDDEADIKVKAALQACREEVGYVDGPLATSLTPEDIKAMNCISACFMKKLRFMKADGELDKEFIFDHSPESRLQDIRKSIEDCKPKSIGDACKLAGCIFLDHFWFDLPTYKHLFVRNEE